MTIRAFEDVHPQLAKDVYVDDMALVLGDVEIGDNSSIWPFSVVRGDVMEGSIEGLGRLLVAVR